MKEIFWVTSGGALGSLARYGISIWLAPLSRVFPWSTIFVNSIGSCVIAFCSFWITERLKGNSAEFFGLFIMVGLCGGFTTFSSFSLQNIELLRKGELSYAFLNIGLSVFLCLATAYLGIFSAQWLMRHL